MKKPHRWFPAGGCVGGARARVCVDGGGGLGWDWEDSAHFRSWKLNKKNPVRMVLTK